MNPGGYSPKLCVRRLRLEVKPRTLLNTVFDRKRFKLVIDYPQNFEQLKQIKYLTNLSR